MADPLFTGVQPTSGALDSGSRSRAELGIACREKERPHILLLVWLGAASPRASGTASDAAYVAPTPSVESARDEGPGEVGMQTHHDEEGCEMAHGEGDECFDEVGMQTHLDEEESEMARDYCEGGQPGPAIDEGWGWESVATQPDQPHTTASAPQRTTQVP